MIMKKALRVLLVIIVVVFIANTVSSDRYAFDFHLDNSNIIVSYIYNTNSETVDHIEIDLKMITLLLCIGLIGVVAFTRKRVMDESHDEDIAPR